MVAEKESDLIDLRSKLEGRVKYEMILSYEFIGDSLKSLKKKDYKKYLLFDNSNYKDLEASSSVKALKRLQEEELD